MCPGSVNSQYFPKLAHILSNKWFLFQQIFFLPQNCIYRMRSLGLFGHVTRFDSRVPGSNILAMMLSAASPQMIITLVLHDVVQAPGRPRTILFHQVRDDKYCLHYDADVAPRHSVSHLEGPSFIGSVKRVLPGCAIVMLSHQTRARFKGTHCKMRFFVKITHLL